MLKSQEIRLGKGRGMKLKTKARKTIFALMEKDHQTTFQRLNEFYDVLRKLRYEGKLNVGKNLAEVNTLVSYFKQELDGHMRGEEKILFPFLQTHIPRLEPMVYLLLSEHEDFRHSLENLKTALQNCKHQAADPILIDKICEQGTYLICLLRSHMWVESHSLYKAADKELHVREKQELIKHIEGQSRG